MKSAFVCVAVVGVLLSSFAQANPQRPARLHLSVNGAIQLQTSGRTETVDIDFSTGRTRPSQTHFTTGRACYQNGHYNAELSGQDAGYPTEGPDQSYCCITSMYLAGATPLIVGANLITSTENRSAAYRNAWHMEGQDTRWMTFQSELRLLASSSADAKRKFRESQPSVSLDCYSGGSERANFDVRSVARQFGSVVTISAIAQ